MFLATDSHYTDSDAITAGALFHRIDDPRPTREIVVQTLGPATYEPGVFYKRELPCILALWNEVTEPVESILVDGYVTLDQEGRPGLGAYLYEALGTERRPSVIGVAKRAFRGSPHAELVLRGSSARPLYITAAGVEIERAAELVKMMHGEYRLPTLLKHVDRLCRTGLTKD